MLHQINIPMKRYYLLGFLLLFINALAVAQQGTLAGKVTDKKTNEGVIGATVLVTGSILAAPVNVDGGYTLPLEPGTYSITVQNLDGPRSFDAKAGSGTLVFVRDGAIETIRRGNGTDTGMKWLADKRDCLIVKAGEGYCRD